LNKFDKKLKEIHPKDLIFVILYGGVISTLLGVLMGLVDYYIESFTGLSFFMLLFFVASMYIGKTVRKQYQFPHIVYIVFTGIFLVIQGVLIFVFPYVYDNAIYYSDYSILYDPYAYLYILQQIGISLITSAFTLNFWLYLEVLVLGVGTYIGVKLTY